MPIRIEQLEQERINNSITPRRQYNEISADLRADSLGKDIATQRSILQNTCRNGRTDLKNTPAVIAQVDAYFAYCQEHCTPPTFLSLCGALGYTRQNIYYWMQKNADHETAQYLSNVQHAIGAILQSQALQKNYDPATAIFIMKNSHLQYSDKPADDPVPTNDLLGDAMRPEDIASKYADMPE